MGYLSAVDAAFLRMETGRTPMHVGGLLVFRIPSNAPANYLRKLFEELRSKPVTLYPFNCRLKSPNTSALRPKWVPVDNIDIDYHVRHSALPYPGGERELGILVARLHSHPLDLERPLWEFHLIEGLENNRFAFYFKAHHCALDGMGAMKLTRRWLTEDAGDISIRAPWSIDLQQNTPTPNHTPHSLQRIGKAIMEQAASASELVKALVRMSDPETHPEGGVRSALETPATLFNQHISPQRRLATQLYDMERFKALSTRTGTTINDVLLTIIGTATRRYLLEQNALPEHPLIASVPVGIPRPDGQPGNAVAGFVCPLLTEQDNELHRLRTINTVTSRTKDQMKQLSTGALNQFALLGLAPLIVAQMTGIGAKLPPFFNFVVSNVSSSKNKLYFCGAEMEAMYPISILFDGYALNVTIVGYADRISIGFTGCRNAIPSLQKLAVYTGEALNALEKAVFADQGERR